MFDSEPETQDAGLSWGRLTSGEAASLTRYPPEQALAT